MSGIVGQNLGRGSGLVKKTAVAADSVTGASIADDAIDSEHYTDGSIDNAHIADDAIDSEHYAAASIDNAHLADDAVDSDELAAGAVDTAHIADNQVTLAKMAGLARGKLIYGDASGDPAALAVGSADEVLTHDGTDLAWAAAGGGGGITNATQWRLNAQVNGSSVPLTANWEPIDAHSAVAATAIVGSDMTESSGVFTFPSTGIWWITSQIFLSEENNQIKSVLHQIQVSLNAGTAWNIGSYSVTHVTGDNYTNSHLNCDLLFDVTNTTNCIARFTVDDDGEDAIHIGGGHDNRTCVTFLRIGDT